MYASQWLTAHSIHQGRAYSLAEDTARRAMETTALSTVTGKIPLRLEFPVYNAAARHLSGVTVSVHSSEVHRFASELLRPCPNNFTLCEHAFHRSKLCLRRQQGSIESASSLHFIDLACAEPREVVVPMSSVERQGHGPQLPPSCREHCHLVRAIGLPLDAI